MPTETRDLAVREGGTAVATPPQAQPMGILQLAVQQGASPEQLEKLLALQERHEANEARKAWVEAMAAFKADPPRIVKDKSVSFGGQRGATAYSHATLGNITSAINAALSAHGLSASWSTEQGDGGITVTCRVTHVMGHAETTSLTASPDKSGSKNDIQAVGSTVTYLERYTLLSILGLATYDQDDDGAAGCGDEYITDAQVSTIYDLLNAMNKTPEQLAPFIKRACGAETIDTIPASKFSVVVNAIKASKKAS